jgi:hypothetical protein
VAANRPLAVSGGSATLVAAGDGSGLMQQLQNFDPKGSFLKNLVLSLLLIGVSSLLIPAVLKQIDDRKAIDQQQFQEQLARQDKIIDAQAEVLDSLATSFWDYEGYASDLLNSAMKALDGTTGTNEPSTPITLNPAQCW